MSREKKAPLVEVPSKERVSLNEKEKAVLRNVIGQFDQATAQYRQQIEQIEAQKTSQLQLFAQLTASATGKDFSLAEYVFEGEDVFIELTT